MKKQICKAGKKSFVNSQATEAKVQFQFLNDRQIQKSFIINQDMQANYSIKQLEMNRRTD